MIAAVGESISRHAGHRRGPRLRITPTSPATTSPEMASRPLSSLSKHPGWARDGGWCECRLSWRGNGAFVPRLALQDRRGAPGHKRIRTGAYYLLARGGHWAQPASSSARVLPSIVGQSTVQQAGIESSFITWGIPRALWRSTVTKRPLGLRSQDPPAPAWRMAFRNRRCRSRHAAVRAIAKQVQHPNW